MRTTTEEEIVLIMDEWKWGHHGHGHRATATDTNSLPYWMSFELNRSVKSLNSWIKQRTWTCGFPAWFKYSVCDSVWKNGGERGSPWQVCVCHEGLTDFLLQHSKWPSVFYEPLSQSLSDLDNEALLDYTVRLDLLDRKRILNVQL